MANMRCKVNKSRKQKGTLHKWNRKSFRLCNVLFWWRQIKWRRKTNEEERKT